MLFSRAKTSSYKSQIPKSGIKIGNTNIEKVTSVKYLGLTIEHKLNWSEHISNKTKAAKKLLFRLKGFIGKTWGPSPEMVRYAYTACVRSTLAYASFAFLRISEENTYQRVKQNPKTSPINDMQPKERYTA